jgi:hypothetical protein
LNPGKNHRPLRSNANRRRFAATALLVAGCATFSQSPMENQTESIEFRFRFPGGSTANVESRTTIQTNWPLFAQPLNETIHEISRLSFESVAESQPSQGGWVDFRNQQLDYSSSFAPPVPYAKLLLGMHFRFSLTSDGAGQEFEPLKYDKKSLLAAKNQKPVEFHRRFAKETAWPAWLAALSERSVMPGKAIQFEFHNYPVGCLGPIATSRIAELTITDTVTCPDKEQCINLSLALNTSKENIIKNMKDALGPGDHDDIIRSLMLNEPVCIDSITALVNPKTMRIYQADYESKVDISAANSTFKDGIQVITSKHVSKSTRYEWHDTP